MIERLRELKQFGQDAEHCRQIGGTEDAQPLPEALAIHRADLIERDTAHRGWNASVAH